MKTNYKQALSYFPRLALSTAIASALCTSSIAIAQDGNDNVKEDNINAIETIVVSARKRTESIQNVPIAITAFSGESLEAKGALSIEGLSQHVPGLNISSGTQATGSSATTSVFMRGIGQIDFMATTDPGVGIYIDDVFYSRAMGSNFDLVDLQSIEVLRGPQGTLFGKNTIGGALVVTSKRPDEDFGGSMQLTIGDFGKVEGKGVVNIPLSDNLLSRFSFIAKEKDGFADRVIGDRLGDEKTIGGRASFLYTPSDRGEISLIIDSIDREATSSVTAVRAYDENAPLAGLWNALVGPGLGLTAPAIVNKDTPFKSNATGPNVDDATTWGASLKVEWEFDDFTFKSVTAHREMETEFARDGDNSPAQYLQSHNVGDQTQFTQEFQLLGSSFDERLDWVVGIYYLEEEADDFNEVRLASGLYESLEAIPTQLNGSACKAPWTAPGCSGNPINIGLDLDFDAINNVDNESLAVFAHATYKLTDDWNITAGLRWFDEEKEYFLQHDRINAGVPLIGATTVSDSWSGVLPLITLDYKINDNSMVYFSSTEGYKSGGYNGRPTTEAEVESFDPEYLWSHEIGYKADLMDGTARLNLAAFYYDYEDIQLSSTNADETGNLILVIQNGGKAETIGFEAELEVRPADGWQITASMAILDAKYKELNEGATVTLDHDLVFTPDLSGTLGVSYSAEIFDELLLTSRMDVSYSGEHFTTVDNSEYLKVRDITLVNARVSLMDFDENWELAVFVTNLTDQEYHGAGLNSFDSFGVVESSIAPPRQVGASLKYNF